VLLSWQPGSGFGGLGIGALAIAGAYLAWGIDNNLTRKVSGSDPVQIAMIKGATAGAVNLALALILGAKLPAPSLTLAAGEVGFVGYGISLVLFVLALRRLGTARTGAYFSTAPFIGALLAIGIFGEPITLQLIIAAGLIALGLYLHLAERHEHDHVHEPVEHEQAHVHDAHHQHTHGVEVPSGEPHVHIHVHAPIVHQHAHYPDQHHQHGHSK
jgi:drug/metabolite transporter (DMT)-like permease